mmetsp:Transcript_8204/g.24359  ORF Transcript_8204/g.24359 Transcript_8204/m.24359 type:complete len:1442 (+) Transcript_8204:217-4542(+)
MEARGRSGSSALLLQEGLELLGHRGGGLRRIGATIHRDLADLGGVELHEHLVVDLVLPVQVGRGVLLAVAAVLREGGGRHRHVHDALEAGNRLEDTELVPHGRRGGLDRGGCGEAGEEEGPHGVGRGGEGLLEEVEVDLRRQAVRRLGGLGRLEERVLHLRAMAAWLKELLAVDEGELRGPAAHCEARADGVRDEAAEVAGVAGRGEDVDAGQELLAHELAHLLHDDGDLLGLEVSPVQGQDAGGARLLEGLQGGGVGLLHGGQVGGCSLLLHVLVRRLVLLVDGLVGHGDVDDDLGGAEGRHERGRVLGLGGEPVQHHHRHAVAVRVLLQRREDVGGRRVLGEGETGARGPGLQLLEGEGAAQVVGGRELLGELRHQPGAQAGADGELRHGRLLEHGGQLLGRGRGLHREALELAELAEVRHDGRQVAAVVAGGRDVEDLLEAELLGEGLDLVGVRGAVLDHEGVGAGEVGHVLQELHSHRQGDHLAAGQHVVHRDADQRLALDLLVQQLVAVHRVAVGREVREERGEALLPAPGGPEHQGERGLHLLAHLLPGVVHEPALQALGRVRGHAQLRGVDLREAARDLGEVRQGLEHLLRLLAEEGAHLQLNLLGVGAVGDHGRQVGRVRAHEVQQDGLRDGGDAVLDEGGLEQGLREAADHEVRDAQGHVAVDLREHERAGDRGVHGLALGERLLHLCGVHLAGLGVGLQQRGEVDRGVAVLLSQAAGHLRDGRARRPHEVEEAAVEVLLDLRVDRVGGLSGVDWPDLADGLVVVDDGHALLGEGLRRLLLALRRRAQREVEDEGDSGHLLLKPLGLVQGDREALEEEAVRVLVRLQLLLDHREEDLRGHRLALVVGLVDLRAEVRAGLHLLLHEVREAEVDEVVLLGELGAVRRGVGPGGADHEDHVGRRGVVHDGVVLRLTRHVDLDDPLLLGLRRRLHGEGHALGVHAELHDAFRALRRRELLRGHGRLVRVVVAEPSAQPLHRLQALRLHLAERHEALGEELLHRRVHRVVAALVVDREGLQVHGGDGGLAEEEVADLVVVGHRVGAHLREKEAHLAHRALRRVAAVHRVARPVHAEDRPEGARPGLLRGRHELRPHELLQRRDRLEAAEHQDAAGPGANLLHHGAEGGLRDLVAEELLGPRLRQRRPLLGQDREPGLADLRLDREQVGHGVGLHEAERALELQGALREEGLDLLLRGLHRRAAVHGVASAVRAPEGADRGGGPLLRDAGVGRAAAQEPLPDGAGALEAQGRDARVLGEDAHGVLVLVHDRRLVRGRLEAFPPDDVQAGGRGRRLDDIRDALTIDLALRERVRLDQSERALDRGGVKVREEELEVARALPGAGAAEDQLGHLHLLDEGLRPLDGLPVQMLDHHHLAEAASRGLHHGRALLSRRDELEEGVGIGSVEVDLLPSLHLEVLLLKLADQFLALPGEEKLWKQ